MFSDYQLLILMKGRERALAGEERTRALLKEAKEASPAMAANPRVLLLKQTIVRALTIALLIVLLALSLTTIARAEATSVLHACVDGQGDLAARWTPKSH
jgi:hypothetical protein